MDRPYTLFCSVSTTHDNIGDKTTRTDIKSASPPFLFAYWGGAEGRDKNIHTHTVRKNLRSTGWGKLGTLPHLYRLVGRLLGG